MMTQSPLHTTLETIEKQHEVLLRESTEMKEADIPQVEAFVEEVEAFVERIAEAGKSTEDIDQRSFLRALIRYWSGIINDKKGKIPPVVRLQPFDLSLRTKSGFGKDYLRKLIEEPSFVSIDDDKRFKNLSKGWWVYDELLDSLARKGWVRFAPGYKSAVYGKSGSEWCIKVLGMGVGENSPFFHEKGFYLEHEREMLETFKRKGFAFQPDVKSQEETIKFLISEEYGVSPQQAELRASRNDVLITRYIGGIPFATETGDYVDYDLNISVMDESVLREMYTALTELKEQLHIANGQGLRHNDVILPNIIFTLDEGDKIVAKLVDFETAQDLNTQSPGSWLEDTVKGLYLDRHVPTDSHGEYTKTLDQYLIDKDMAILDKLIQTASERALIKSVFPEQQLTIGETDKLNIVP